MGAAGGGEEDAQFGAGGMDFEGVPEEEDLYDDHLEDEEEGEGLGHHHHHALLGLHEGMMDDGDLASELAGLGPGALSVMLGGLGMGGGGLVGSGGEGGSSEAGLAAQLAKVRFADEGYLEGVGLAGRDLLEGSELARKYCRV